MAIYSNTTWDASDGWNGHTVRVWLPASQITQSAETLTLKLGYKDADWTFAKVYIGHAAASGDAYDFDGTQVQVLFSASAGGTVSVGGLTSDEITYSLDETKNLVVAIYLASATTVPKHAIGSGETCYYCSGDDAATTNTGGYSTSASQVQMVDTLTATGSTYEVDITDTATMTDTMDGDSWTRDISDTATMTDTMSAVSTLNVSISETATMTDTMEPLHLVETVTETATMTDEMVADDMIRKRIRHPNLQGKHLSLKFTSDNAGTFALYYLRHKMRRTVALCNDRLNPNVQGTHISLKVQTTGDDAATIEYASMTMRRVEQ